MSSIQKLKLIVLTKENYPLWQRQAKAVLIEKDLWDTIEAPHGIAADDAKPGDPLPGLTAAEKKMDRKAISTLELMVGSAYIQLIKPDSTAAEAWQAIKQVFGPATTIHLMNLRRELLNAKLQPNEDIATYSARINTLRQRLQDAGKTFDDNDIKEALLSGLTREYDTAVELVTQDANISIDNMIARLTLTEERIKKWAPKKPPFGGPSAYTAYGARPDFPTKSCLYCKRSGHTANECRQKLKDNALRQKPNNQQFTKPAVSCTYCGKAGHHESRCYAKQRAERQDGSGRAAIAYQATAFSSSLQQQHDSQPRKSTHYDRGDFQLEHSYFNKLNAKYGPYDLDAASHPSGNNSFCKTWCSKDNDFCDISVAGCNVWCNPPFKSAKKFLEHYLRCKDLDPTHTSGTFILPFNQDANWWHLTKGMRSICRWSAGTQLFTMPGLTEDAPRRRMKPCHFDVVAFYDAPATASNTNRSSFKYFCLSASTSANVASAMKMTTAGVSPEIIVDSGASHHMTSQLEYLSNVKELPNNAPGVVKTASGSCVNVQGVGDLHLSLKSGAHKVTLPNVLYIPDLDCTLLSLPTILASGGQADFAGDSCNISTSEDPSVPKLQGKLSAGSSRHQLFILQDVSIQAASAYTAQADFTAQLWHQRLGHLGYQALADLTTRVDGISVSASAFKQRNEQGKGVCGPCMDGRQSRLPRTPTDTARSTVPLHRVSADLCGPMTEDSINGSKYYLLVIDEATRYSVLQPISKKSDAAGHIISIFKKLRATCGNKVVYFRTDGGGEFVNTELAKQLQDMGITHEVTPAYSPESNGMAERANRTIMEKLRSMQSWAELPNYFWAECAVYANLLRNLSPAAGISKTPWELMHGTKPNISQLRIYGALCYIHKPKELRSKLDFKTERGIIVGHDFRAHTYRVYVNGSIRTVRDVKADETKPGWPILQDDEDEDDLPMLQHPTINITNEPVNSVSDNSEPDNSEPDNSDQSPIADLAPSPELEDNISDTDSGADSDADSDTPDYTETSNEPRYPRRSNRAPPGFHACYTAAAVAATPIIEPLTVTEAKQTPQWPEWKQAMQAEMDALHSNNTWELASTPSDVTPLPCKWVFKLKRNQDGSIERFKARLVAGGHRQKDGIDYAEVYAPVSRLATFRALMAKVACEDLEMHSVDISNAFLNGELDPPVYMKQPEDFNTEPSHISCKLQRSLYGLKQAPKEWHNTLSKALTQLGFNVSESDRALWVKPSTKTTAAVYLVMWVDDLIMASTPTSYLCAVKDKLLTIFKGRDLGEATSYLNMAIKRDRTLRTLNITQPTHINNLLQKLNMQDCKGKAVPFAPGADLSESADDDTLLGNSSPYAEAVGALMYICSTTRPDLSVSVSLLARVMSKPTTRHWNYLKNVMRYVSATKHLGITYGTTSTGLLGYTDSDYASCKDTRKSRSGSVFILYGGAVTWSSKLQTVIATSTAEAEYIAAANAARDAIWLKRICKDLDVKTDQAVPLYADNQSAIHMATNSADTARTKHIDVCYHFLRNNIARGNIRMIYCTTEDNVADMFTKPLPYSKLQKFSTKIGVDLAPTAAVLSVHWG
jgi:transposase InsO family protein